MPLYRFQFAPETLTRFTLVYENADFRVFAVGKSTQAWKGPPLAVYDARLFMERREPDGTITLDVASSLARMHRSRRQLVLAAMLARAGRSEEAVMRYDEAASQWPADPEYRGDFEALKKALLQRRP
jgi:hypothetical protein